MDSTHNALEQSVARKPRRRLRFGLKTLLIAMTIACLLLGYRFARVRRAEEMIARHDRLWNTVTKNIATPLERTFYRSQVGSEDEISEELSWPGHLRPKGVILGTGSMATLCNKDFTTDFSQLLSQVSRESITHLIIDHYSRGLDDAGLTRCYGYQGRLQQCAVWASPRNDLMVVIDVSASSDDPYADVRILLIDSQQLLIW